MAKTPIESTSATTTASGKVGLLAGILGVSAIAAIVAALIFYMVRRKRQRRRSLEVETAAPFDARKQIVFTSAIYQDTEKENPLYGQMNSI